MKQEKNLANQSNKMKMNRLLWVIKFTFHWVVLLCCFVYNEVNEFKLFAWASRRWIRPWCKNAHQVNEWNICFKLSCEEIKVNISIFTFATKVLEIIHSVFLEHFNTFYTATSNYWFKWYSFVYYLQFTKCTRLMYYVQNNCHANWKENRSYF